MLGQLVPYLQQKYGLVLMGAGLFSTLQSVGGIAAVCIYIMYLDWVSKPKLLAVLGIVFGIQMAFVGMMPTFLLACLLFVLIGFVNSFVNALSNAVVSDYTMEQRGLYLNLLHGFFGLGGAVGSQAAGFIKGVAGIEQTFLWFGVIAAGFAFSYHLLLRRGMQFPVVAVRQSSAVRLHVLKQAIKIPGMISVVLVAFFNAFVLINVLYFTYSYVYGLSGNIRISAAAITVFFVFMALSRFIGTKLTKRLTPKQFVFWGSLLGFGAYIIAGLTVNVFVVVAMIGMLGFFTGNHLPQITNAACSIIPETSAAATGLITLGYFLATIVASPIIGWVGDAFSLKHALMVNALMLVPAAMLSLKMGSGKLINHKEYQLNIKI